jgi:hypothetical protein
MAAKIQHYSISKVAFDLIFKPVVSGRFGGQYNLPTYEMSLKSDNVEFVCGIVAAILKMATARNFSMSGHHNLPIYQI